MPTIMTSRVKEIREARKLSQAALIRRFDSRLKPFQGETNITKRTLQRIEANTAETETVRDGTFNILVKLLDVEPGVLTGELPIPEDLAPKKPNQRKSEPDIMTVDEEVFETRLVKLDDKFVIVEFSNAYPTGRIIARDIVDEAAGLRLSAASELRSKLLELHKMLSHPDGFYTGWAEHYETEFFHMGMDLDDHAAVEKYADNIGRMLKAKPVKHHSWISEKPADVETQIDSQSLPSTQKAD